jgi:hypothetical protein
MSRTRRRIGATTIFALVAASAAALGMRTQGLTNGPALAHIYDQVLDARFEAAAEAMEGACPPAPEVSCQMIGAAALWWRLLLDPDSRALDAALEARVNEAISSAEQWTVREPRRGEAWFYLGAGYGVRVQFRVLRGERLAAARDGKRIKDALERALQLDPSLQDAYFGIGLYHYYADVVPAALRFLRWLFLLPGGNKAEGMAEMVRARERGALLRGEADFQIHLLYLWYEAKPQPALTLLEGLRARYPYNPVFLQRIAEVHDVYFHDAPASLAAWDALLAQARRQRVALPDLAEVQGRLGAARQLDALYETDRAIETLRPIIERKPQAPYGAVAQAQLLLGRAYQRLGQQALATSALNAAVAATPADDRLDTASQARAALRRRPDARVTEAYRLSLDGWRAFERGSLGEADEALAAASALQPNDPVIRYRRAKLLAAHNQGRQALQEFERVIVGRPLAPPIVLAAAYLEAGRLLEREGNRPRAIEMYRAASAVRGSDPQTHAAALRSLQRLNGTSAR